MIEEKAVEQQTASACCGGPAPKDVDACCVKDADAKSAGESGCGCNAPATAKQSVPPAASCCG